MKLSYDPKTGSLYIHLAERPSVDSDEVSDGVVLDFDESRTLVVTIQTPTPKIVHSVTKKTVFSSRQDVFCVPCN